MEIMITKETILKYLKELMDEHEETGYCLTYNQAIDDLQHNIPDEDKFDRFYDAGRYETLCEIYRTIEVANETT